MVKIFKKQDIIRSFKVEDNKVFTTITLGDFNVTNPTLEQFLSIGWEEYIYPEIEPEPYIPSIEELVEQKIRKKYSINQEFEVQRKRDTEPEEFSNYFIFVEKCIEEANREHKNAIIRNELEHQTID